MPLKLLRMHRERILCVWFMFTRFPHHTNHIFQPAYMQMMSAELANERSLLPHVRNAAGLALKNALTARVRQYPAISVLCEC